MILEQKPVHNATAIIGRMYLLYCKQFLYNLAVKVFLCLSFYKVFTIVFFYVIFRLLFGTLYPAYASYKAVKTKHFKEYVSNGR